MQYSKVCMLIFISIFVGCKNHTYSIYETSSLEGPSGDLYVEGSIIDGLNPSDTILYYKFDLLGCTGILKQSAKLNIGVSCSRNARDSFYSVNLGFNSVPKDMPHGSLQISTSGNTTYFTNFKKQGYSRGMETAVAFKNDKYLTPVTPTLITSEEKMKEFLEMFNTEIRDAANKTDTIVYTSVCHLEGYYKNIVMRVALK